MDAHAGSAAPERHPRLSRGWTRWRQAGLLLLEHLAIAGGYVLLGWLGMWLMPDGRLITIWPAGGFALAMLLLRGTSRWPAILLGSLLSSYWLVPWRWVVPEGVPLSAVLEATTTLLTSMARAFSTVVGVWLVDRYVGTRRWPHTVREVIGFVLVAGLVQPAIAALSTHAALLGVGLVEPGPLFLRQTWIWFNANSAGIMAMTPLFLAFAEGPTGRPHRTRWEVALVAAFALITAFIALDVRRRFNDIGIPLSYPMIPIILWAAMRFGSQGAVLTNLLWACVAFYSMYLLKVGETELGRGFTHYQARFVVLTAFILVLAAAFEERHQMQQALEKEREGLEARVAERTRELARFLSLLHSSLESTADGLLVVDRKGHITAMNQRFAELWRLPASVLESGDDARALGFIREQLVEPDVFLSRVEYLYAHPELESEDEVQLTDGRVFHRVSRPQLLGEEIVGRVWSFRDITLRRRAEAERDRLLVEESRARQEAERAFREAQKALGVRDEFLSIAAHEMKTPLTSMKMQFQHLQRLVAGASGGQVEAARLKPVVAAALRQMRRFQELGDQLLDMTQLSTGRLEPRHEPLDFQEVVAEQLELHAEAARKARAELRLECGGPIPGECDRLRLERIVGCLLSNAIKFGAGSPLTIRLEAQESRVRLRVVDQGIGIAPEDHERIFEKLERAVDSRHYGGLGLGLWIARQSAEALGGHITVESELGKGATFTVELPRSCQSLSMRRIDPPAEPARPTA
ncbi:signal transduction histidine kinase [Archangium gephyra]|uniref:histidine kinase n=1 Tax=Archangium gephyra TaxID=48 RepID=A0AAC8TF57_9BACT|nr:ATP-binding protein [Archangium gephyra]AKJ03722.1 diguanylate cyclase/phosphodiesterase [Archangium gephyra]REG22499.1 signal transduction histidine kinase [Archangium gephyra]